MHSSRFGSGQRIRVFFVVVVSVLSDTQKSTETLSIGVCRTSSISFDGDASLKYGSFGAMPDTSTDSRNAYASYHEGSDSGSPKLLSATTKPRLLPTNLLLNTTFWRYTGLEEEPSLGGSGHDVEFHKTCI